MQDFYSLTISPERLPLLMRVSEVLLSTEDPDEAVGQLASEIVPQLADWSFISVIDDEGYLHDIGLAHRDPSKAADLRAYADCHLENMTEVAAVSRGLRTGQPVVVPYLDDAMLASFLPDPDVAHLTRRLDPYGVAVFPLRAPGGTFGVMVSVTTSARGSHTPEELATLLEISRRAGPVLGAARAARRDRVLAESLQRNLLQVAAPGPGLDVAVRYRPANSEREVGGDWYDLFSLADGSTIASIGDVVGHDLAAIAAMAQLRSFLRANAWLNRHSPAEILRSTDAVSTGLGPGSFATAVTLELAPPAPDGTVGVIWSNAGHPPPVLITPDGTSSFLGPDLPPDLPLGVAPHHPRHNHRTELTPGSTMLLYTDGLVEHRGSSIDVGLERLLRHLHHSAARSLETILDDLCTALGLDDAHEDDVALLAIRVR